MTPDQHAHVKELFLKARELGTERREEFLRQQCGEDTDLFHEVTSLIKHDSADTILTRTDKPPFYPLQQVGRPPGRVLSRIESAAHRILRIVLGKRSSRWVAIAVALLLLAALAMWTHRGMKQSSQSIAASELQTILSADVTALELWIEEKKKDVRLWSSQPEIKQAVVELVEIAGAGGDANSLRSAPALENLRSELEQFDRIVGRPERDALISRDGLVLGAGEDEMVGFQLPAEIIAALVPVFQGQTLFLKPRPDPAFDSHADDLKQALLYVVAPITRDDSGRNEIVAAGAFGFPAEDEFSKILSVARQGQSGETYAFNHTGLLLNESRFDEQLRASGLLPQDPTSRSILRIEIRDPGGDRSKWKASSLEAAERPLTALAAKAIAAGRKASEREQQGVILQPYRNYRGAEVIGAWKWLPKYAMGVASEVEVQEQFAPLRYPLIAEWIRFGMLAGCVVLLLAAASWIVLLGRDVVEARRLGQYTLQEVIGKGGMGVVYRAQHALLQRPTAIKLLRPEAINDASMARFEREAQLASELTHPNTVDIFDFGRTPQGSFYCVMEYLQGRTLEDLVSTEGPLPANRVVNFLSQIAGSLQEAHQHGIVHRDIKPSNIMLCQQGGIPDFVKVLDFGLARPVHRSGDHDLTRPGLIAGTPPYVAPERITDPSIIDPRSDLYSFGAVGFYLLTGRNAFQAEKGEGLIQQIMTASPPAPSDVTSHEIPAELDRLVVRCLARDVEDRPASAHEVLITIAKINADLVHPAG